MDVTNVNCECSSNQEKQKLDEISNIIDLYKGKNGSLIQVLHLAQEIYGYLPIEVQKIIASSMDIPLSEVSGVITFYSFFSLEPKGEFNISICLGTACYVKGASAILEKIEKNLGVKAGKCTADRKFSVNVCRCIGACGLAPVITINEDVYGRLEPDELPGILAKYKEA